MQSSCANDMDLWQLNHDIVTWYIFWSLFYGLGPMIWFYPLNELDITGYEAFAAVWLIPIITAIGPLRRLLSKTGGLFVLMAGMLVGILSFDAPTTWSRLAILSFGNGAAMLYLSVKLFSGPVKERYRHFWLLIAANFIFLTSRIFTCSIAPVWANRELNMAVAGIYLGNIGLWIVRQIKGEKSPGEVSEERQEGKKESKAPNITENSPGFFRQIGHGMTLGSVIYLSHWVFGELGVLSRWSTSGFPHSGPSPIHSSPVVLACLIFGAVFSHCFPKITNSRLIWLLGSLSFFGTYLLDAWSGFGCGLCLAVFCSILWINTMEGVVLGHPGTILTFAMLTYLAEIFFHVWTVAYNFVPGGVYTREHSDYLIAFMCLTFFGAFGCSSKIPKSTKIQPTSISTFFALTMAMALLGTAIRLPNQPAVTKHLDPSSRHFSALIWTFHFGYNNQGWPSLRRAADLLRKTDADVIALLESDASKPYLGHNDLAMWLSEELGMFVDFGPATKDHTWGNLLLSKYPIVNSTHHLLPSPHGELAPAISATLNISGSLVDIISTHMGNDRDSVDRDVQTKYLSAIAAASFNPVVFLGYVTSPPFSRDYVHFTGPGSLTDIDPSDKSRFCEYILYKKLIRQGYARISHGGLSDTELQLARFSIPRDSVGYHDNARIQLDPLKVPEWQRFSGDFGNYTVGHYYAWRHHYHMSTPKYFF